MSDVDPAVEEWLTRFAVSLETAPLSTQELDDILSLAGHAARSSARQAAPAACWLAARCGLDPSVALERARAVE